jgi:hypothetical protein
MSSTQRLPLVLAVPWNRLCLSTLKRKAFGPTVRGLHSMLGQNHPEGVHLRQQVAGKPPRIILLS